ncbi:FMN-binding protein [Desulfofalx alkaliphila]|uniref:FMN-binding protein n=1 Tax=Desulfofalx alkaliphila TaxID=105483 RepID=UPI000690E742|nr:FMN-binding protein [Desulfofalx alkaliphila]
MDRKRLYLGLFVAFVVLIFVFTRFLTGGRSAISAITGLYTEKVNVQEITGDFKPGYVEDNFPAVQNIYQVQDEQQNVIGYGFIVKTSGYNGPMTIAVTVDGYADQVKGIKVLEHVETPVYAEYLSERWFTDRFKGKSLGEYLNLVVLDPENPSDIVQITGATISSQAVVNGVNSAIGAYNYLKNGQRMAAVPAVVDKLIVRDENSFTVHWGTDEFIRITVDELKKHPTVKESTVLMRTSGTRENIVAEGPLLSEVLKRHGIKLADYQGIGVTGRDGYYALMPKELLEKRRIILAHKVNGEEILKEDEPVRVVVPDEMGVYWVRMVSNIDLYSDIAEKDVKSVKIFEPLTRDIEPYLYEYYGSKDEAIEIGKILAKFDNVNTAGFFTMVSSDGLLKNEVINMVRQRYYIKISGEGAPMNIAPNFKLGMNVKNMAYFSTTEDAVIFPQEMQKITGLAELNGQKGMNLHSVLIGVGVITPQDKQFELVNTAGQKIEISGRDLDKCVLVHQGDGKIIAFLQDVNGLVQLDDLLEINELT